MGKASDGVARMPLPNSCCSPEDTIPTPECLIGRVKEVRGVLRSKGFSQHAIEHAVTVVYRVAMPYVNRTKICQIKNRRAWVFRVAIRAATRAAKRDVCSHTVEPAILAATMEDSEPGEELFDICKAMKQLTKQQSDAVERCILKDMSLREAAKEMGIAVSTLCGHLSAAKEHLKEILPPLLPPSWPKHFYPSALAS